MNVPTARFRVLLATLALVLVAAGGSPAAAQATSPSLPWVTVSPLAGTPDATPATQISFLGAPAADISQIVVRGSQSGIHAGRLEPYATGTGASYLPDRPFTVGEQVTVSAVETINGVHRAIGTSFTIGRLYALPAASGPTGATGATGAMGATGAAGASPTAGVSGTASDGVETFASLPGVHPPAVTVTTPASDPALGDVFLTPVDGPSQAGAMIVNPTGQLVWFAPAAPGNQATDLRVQQYLGKTVLTYWQGRIAYGHGIGTGVIDNQAYEPIAKVHAGNGLSMDLHDFELGPDGVAWITVYEPVYDNLSSVGGSSDGIIEDCVIQEIDVRTGLVMFEWHALGHVPLSASYSPPSRSPGSVWDWFHLNSIDVEPDQNILISSRNTWTVYQIGHTFGEVIWQLGGHASSFALGPNVRFAWQHDATMITTTSLEIFDNEDTPEIEGRSRAIDVSLNFSTHTATLAHQYETPTTNVLSPSQGDVQQLPNADQFVGWGQVGLVSEFSPTNALTFQLTLPPLVQSYRAYRFPWSGQPITRPTVAANVGSAAGTTAVAVNWNGATNVASWQVLAGSSPEALAPVGSPVATAGFETQITAPTSAPFVAVRALGKGGAVLSTSLAVSVQSSPA
ncbi:MAG: arylsulfotransferase family protein [Solirubrobacteraceae bacterium]